MKFNRWQLIGMGMVIFVAIVFTFGIRHDLKESQERKQLCKDNNLEYYAPMVGEYYCVGKEEGNIFSCRIIKYEGDYFLEKDCR